MCEVMGHKTWQMAQMASRRQNNTPIKYSELSIMCLFKLLFILEEFFNVSLDDLWSVMLFIKNI